MAKKEGKKVVRSKEELLAGFKEIEIANHQKWRKCKNCKNSFYRSFKPTANFPEPDEVCGCRLKCSLVNPNGLCEQFA